MIKILIVDDHPMLRTVVRVTCQDNDRLEVVGEASDGPAALELAKQLGPDVIVLDLGIPGMEGLEVVKRLRDDGFDCKILILTGRDDPKDVFASLRAHVDGYLEKTSALENIGELIERVAGGERLIGPELHKVAFTQLGSFVRNQREASQLDAKLTPRELEVLDLIEEAMTTGQMARRMGLSERTVESHIGKLYRKLGVRSRTEALARAHKLGFLKSLRS